MSYREMNTARTQKQQ